jgi:2-polyprenyl-3-methyl-5-hydroxy-6-metoxy-1,4-benzoquinol methylase
MMLEIPHKYEYTIDLDGDTAPARVVRMVGHSKKVLEIGAGPGSITRVLQDYCNCHVTALEVDSKAIKKLAGFCGQVHQADLNDPRWMEHIRSEGQFDVVLAADVLEHLYDPLVVLKSMKELVREQGYIVVSLPHVGHSAVGACLLDEDFEYRDWGLLDRTHIRFFGMKNMQSLFEHAGLKIVRAEFVIRAPEVTEFAERWGRLPETVRRVLESNPFGRVYQVVLKAVPQEAEGYGIALCSLSPESPHSEGTIRHPLSGNRWTRAIKSWARKYISPEWRLLLRRLAGYFSVTK